MKIDFDIYTKAITTSNETSRNCHIRMHLPPSWIATIERPDWYLWQSKAQADDRGRSYVRVNPRAKKMWGNYLMGQQHSNHLLWRLLTLTYITRYEDATWVFDFEPKTTPGAIRAKKQ